MLSIFKILLENAYLAQYIPKDYYTQKFWFYKNNNNNFCQCLKNIIFDFERLIQYDKSS